MERLEEGEWVEIFVTYDPVESGIVKDILESGGISVVVRSSRISPYPVNIGKMGEVRLLVRKTDEEAAEMLIREFGD
jgi:hypothetical protein